MGIAEIISNQLFIRSTFFFYGEAATETLSEQIAADIANHWNEPNATVMVDRRMMRVIFDIKGFYSPQLNPEDVYYNYNPQNNYFRIEEFSNVHISFVDDIPCNTGYFKLDNLLNNSTTAAHEYGHTLGLKHPELLDIRGEGQPGIMYPRGTICDPHFQYDAAAQPLAPGGTMNPYKRKVLQKDIDALKLYRLQFDKNSKAIIGDFSSLWHDKHLPAA
ncbi:MAG: peptidase M10 [Sphingobacteriales bacterium]|nr:MAG: peptidase M10 [Sphingobacteriales bacterium]